VATSTHGLDCRPGWWRVDRIQIAPAAGWWCTRPFLTATWLQGLTSLQCLGQESDLMAGGGVSGMVSGNRHNHTAGGLIQVQEGWETVACGLPCPCFSDCCAISALAGGGLVRCVSGLMLLARHLWAWWCGAELIQRSARPGAHSRHVFRNSVVSSILAPAASGL
jgi:hypothetical protein